MPWGQQDTLPHHRPGNSVSAGHIKKAILMMTSPYGSYQGNVFRAGTKCSGRFLLYQRVDELIGQPLDLKVESPKECLYFLFPFGDPETDLCHCVILFMVTLCTLTFFLRFQNTRRHLRSIHSTSVTFSLLMFFRTTTLDNLFSSAVFLNMQSWYVSIFLYCPWRPHSCPQVQSCQEMSCVSL